MVKERLAEEQGELMQKKEKLRLFVETNKGFEALSKAQQYLLKQQLEVMSEYIALLEARISIVEED